MQSIWEIMDKKIKIDKKEIDENHIFDVIVVGAGMAGLLIAHRLKEAGKDVLVLEAKRVGSNVSSKTTAKITCQHGLKYHNLIKNIGEEKAKLYAQANEKAIDDFETLIKERNIDCDFKRNIAYLYTKNQEEKLLNEKEAAIKLGIDCFYEKKCELAFEVKGVLGFHNQAQFSPLKFMYHIAKDLNIIENTRVIGIQYPYVYSKDKKYKAKDIVIATHYPIKNIPGFYFARMHQERSYVVALKTKETIENMYYGIDEDGLSFRQTQNCILIGGKGHRCGEDSKDAYASLLKEAKQLYPRGEFVTCWSTQDCISHDGIAFIGTYSLFTKHLFVASGFQKWGMSTSMIASTIICDKICGIENPYASLFSPQRMYLKYPMKKRLYDLKVSSLGLWKGHFSKPVDQELFLLRNEEEIALIKNKKYACFKDEKGKLHKISAKCPHMGCELVWNKEEKSWDCPCHGSRFDIDGNILNVPSVKDAKTKEN